MNFSTFSYLLVFFIRKIKGKAYSCFLRLPNTFYLLIPMKDVHVHTLKLAFE